MTSNSQLSNQILSLNNFFPFQAILFNHSISKTCYSSMNSFFPFIQLPWNQIHFFKFTSKIVSLEVWCSFDPIIAWSIGWQNTVQSVLYIRWCIPALIVRAYRQTECNYNGGMDVLVVMTKCKSIWNFGEKQNQRTQIEQNVAIREQRRRVKRDVIQTFCRNVWMENMPINTPKTSTLEKWRD